MRVFQWSRPQYINYQYQYQLGPGHALLVAVCIFMLPMLEVATEHVQLINRRNNNHADKWCTYPHHMIKHTLLVLPPLNYVLPAMVLQNGVVKSNTWCLSCSSSRSSVHFVFVSLGVGIPAIVGKWVVGIVVVLLLLISGDIEMNPGPGIGESFSMQM